MAQRTLTHSGSWLRLGYMSLMCHLATIELPYDNITLSIRPSLSQTSKWENELWILRLIHCDSTLLSAAKCCWSSWCHCKENQKARSPMSNSWALFSQGASQEVKVGYQVSGLISKKIETKALKSVNVKNYVNWISWSDNLHRDLIFIF